MTLCVAAHAEQDFDPKVVLLSDLLISTDDSSSEWTDKMVFPFIGDTALLWSGAFDHINDVVSVYRKRLVGSGLTLPDFKTELWSGFKGFLALLKQRGQKISDAQLIVAGFVENVPRIIAIDRHGVSEYPHFLSIGVGAYHGDTILKWRDCTAKAALSEVLYCLYEAKKFGELSPFVGKRTSMQVLEKARQGLTMHHVVQEDMDILDEKFKEIWPTRHVNSRVHLKHLYGGLGL